MFCKFSIFKTKYTKLILQSTCFISGFVVFWTTKYHTHPYLSLIIGTQRLYKLFWLSPIHLFKWISPLLNNCLDYISSRFIITSSWVCMNYLICGQKVFLSSRPWITLSFLISWCYFRARFTYIPARNKTFWVFDMSVLLELTTFMAMICRITFICLTTNYQCQAT